MSPHLHVDGRMMSVRAAGSGPFVTDGLGVYLRPVSPNSRVDPMCPQPWAVSPQLRIMSPQLRVEPSVRPFQVEWQAKETPEPTSSGLERVFLPEVVLATPSQSHNAPTVDGSPSDMCREYPMASNKTL